MSGDEAVVAGGAPRSAPADGGVVGLLRQAAPDLGALASLAAAVVLGIGLIVWSLGPDWVPVPGQSSDNALEVIDSLSVAGVEYRMDTRSGLVLVPAERVGEVRMAMAASGLDADSGTGIEMLDREPSLGTSQGTELRRYQHALETELARTLSTLRNVESARVHLALPERSVFIRDRESASASVTLHPEPGRSVETEQVDAVTRLVAASIPYLKPSDVTVVDQWGQLLSMTDDADGASRAQFRHARQLEQLYASRIEALLTPVLGAGRIRATVTADIDFSQNESTAELFAGDPKVRSEQTDRQVDSLAEAIGIPGALVNQPPGAGTVDPVGEIGAPVDTETTAISATRNYELDRTITRSQRSPGTIRRLSAAVVIDDRMAPNEAGELVRVGPDEESLAAYTALVREAIGFDAARGDTVTVSNRAFLPVEAIAPPEPAPLWEQPWLATILRQGLVGLAVLMLVFVGVRPALRKLTQRPGPPGGQARLETDRSQAEGDASGSTGAALGDERQGGDDGKTAGTNRLEPPREVYGDILNMARAMASDDPKRVARLVKDWVADG